MEKPKISSYSVFSQFGWCQGARLSALPPGIEISKKYIFLAFFIARHYEGLLRWASIEVHAAQWEMGWPLCFCQIWVSPTILFSSRMWARMKYSAIFHQIAHLNKEFWQAKGNIPSVRLMVARVGEVGSRRKTKIQIEPPTIIKERWEYFFHHTFISVGDAFASDTVHKNL